MMADEKPTYEELEARLAEAERIIKNIRRGEIDAVLGQDAVYLLRLKEMEDALRASEKKAVQQKAEIEAIYDSAPVGLCVFDRNLRFVRINRRLAEINGLSVEEHFGKALREIVPELAPTAEKISESIFRTGEPVFNIEFSGRTPAQPNRLRYWNEHWLPLKDINGNVTGISVVAEEITERKEVEEALRTNEERLNAALTATGGAIYDHWVPLDERTYHENRCAELLGYRPDELPSYDRLMDWLFSQVHIDDREQLERAYHDFVEARISRYCVQVRLRHKQGHWVWIEGFSHAAEHDENGRVRRVVGLMTDISDRKSVENALQRAHDELEMKVAERTAELQWKNRELQEFANVAAHDLQEPLRKIQAFGDMLQHKLPENLPDSARDYLSRMTGAATRMRNLINNLFSYSRVSTRTRPFKRVDLKQIAKKVVNELHVPPDRLEPIIEIEDLAKIDADSTQIYQLLQNLVSNAIRYSKNGEISRVKISCCKVQPLKGSRKTFCELRVEDNGIGFDMQYLDKIFKPFERLHGGHQYEGTGMGLAICRRIVERHGGHITAQSQPGQGSTFIAALPMRQIGDRRRKTD